LFAAFTCIRYQPLIVTCFRPAEPERQGEADAAADVLGCKRHQWPLDSEHDDEEELESFMWGLLDPASDDVPQVFAPAVELQGLAQHSLVGEVADRVFGNENVTHYLTYAGHPRVKSRSNNEVPYESEWLFVKHRALTCYWSQAQTASAFHFAEDLREYRA